MPCAYRKTQGSASPSSTRQKGARLKRMEPRPSVASVSGCRQLRMLRSI